MGGRSTWIGLGVAGCILLPATAAQAAGTQLRVLNAGGGPRVTIQIDGKTEFSKVTFPRATRRHNVRAGGHVFVAKLGKRVVASRRIVLKGGQFVTIVYALKGRRSSLSAFVEPAPVAGVVVVRVANFASKAGAVSIRVGSTVLASRVAFGGATRARRLALNASPTGLMKVSARRRRGAPLTGHDPLVLASHSVGLFVLIPRGRSAQVFRLPYTTPVAAPTKQPSLVGTRRFDHTIRCTGDHWRPKSVSTKRRWTVDGRTIGSGTSLTLSTARDAGHTIACTVSATLNHMTTSATASFKLPAVPAVITPPSVKAPAGTLAAGQTVTCDHGVWKSAPSTYVYRWIRKGTGAEIATGRTYTLKLPGDNGAVNSLGCEVIATNNGGHSVATRSANTVALGIAPSVAIVLTSKPTNPTTVQAADFAWTIGGGGASTVECSLDNAAFVPCAGPLTQSYGAAQLPTALNGRPHTFTVRATNPVASVSDTYDWQVNPVAPTVTLTTVPTNPSLVTTPSFSWTVGGGISTVTCKLDNGPTQSCTSPRTLSAPTSAAGTPHTFTVTATNITQTTPAVFTWTVNPQLPTVGFVTVPAASSADTSPTFTWSAGGGGATGFSCQVDTGTVHACGTSETPTGLASDPSGAPHTFKVTATNASGDSAPATYNWTIFSQPVLSSVAVDAVDQTTHADVTVTFVVTGTTTSVTCQIDGGPAVNPCPSGHVFPDPGPGTHTVSVSASNVAGTDTQSAPSWTFLP